MEVLEAYDLTGSYRSTAQLCGVDHHTVKKYVAARAAGVATPVTPVRSKVSDPFLAHVEGWVDRSKGQIRADRVHAKLVELGYEGSERTTRRVVAAVKRDWRRDNARAYKPWLPEPGLWLHTISVTAQSLMEPRRCCFALGWRGHRNSFTPTYPKVCSSPSPRQTRTRITRSLTATQTTNCTEPQNSANRPPLIQIDGVRTESHSLESARLMQLRSSNP